MDLVECISDLSGETAAACIMDRVGVDPPPGVGAPGRLVIGLYREEIVVLYLYDPAPTAFEETSPTRVQEESPIPLAPVQGIDQIPRGEGLVDDEPRIDSMGEPVQLTDISADEDGESIEVIGVVDLIGEGLYAGDDRFGLSFSYRSDEAVPRLADPGFEEDGVTTVVRCGSVRGAKDRDRGIVSDLHELEYLVPIHMITLLRTRLLS